MSLPFQNKVMVITGGSSGIGEALVKQFLNAGAFVATCGRHEEKLDVLKKGLANPNLFTYTADVSLEEDCKKFIENVVQKFGRIDVLINNAGRSMRALFGDLEDLSVLKKLMDTNFWGCVYCTRYALPELRKSRGVIVGISSIAGYRGLPGRIGYSSSKFAMQGFLEVLRTELLYTGVHVMWVCPGFTASNIRSAALNKQGQAQAETPLKENKLMTPEKVASLTYNAIIKRKRTCVMTSQGKLTVFMNKFFPSLTDKLVYNFFKKEHGSPLKTP